MIARHSPVHSYGDPLEEVVSRLLIARFLGKAIPQRSQKCSSRFLTSVRVATQPAEKLAKGIWAGGIPTRKQPDLQGTKVIPSGLLPSNLRHQRVPTARGP